LEGTGGFDEAMVGWGHEDIDLGYRVFRWYGRDSARFHFDPLAYCFHLPHLADWARNYTEAGNNERHLKHKHHHYEIEVLGLDAFVWAALKVPYYKDVLARYCESSLGAVPQGLLAFLRADASVLLIGRADAYPTARHSRTFFFDHTLPESSRNYHLLGLATPFADLRFDDVINVDLWRFLTTYDFNAMVHEALRTGRRLHLVHSGQPSSSSHAQTPGLVPADDVPGYVHNVLQQSYTVVAQSFGRASVLTVTMADSL
jgi:hypothetical protein